MTVYQYVVVRCVPRLTTGEFVNAAVVVGNAERDEWVLCRPDSWSHVRKLASTSQVQLLETQLERLEGVIGLDSGQIHLGGSAVQSRLDRLRGDLRSLVQLDESRQIVAPDLASAARIARSSLLVDSQVRSRPEVTRQHLQNRLVERYEARLPGAALHKKVILRTGTFTQIGLDFAVGADQVLQLAHTLSFQVGSLDRLRNDIGSLSASLERLRSGKGAHLVDLESARVSREVEFTALYASPRTAPQREVFNQAEEMFDGLGVTLVADRQVDEIAVRAEILVNAA